MSAHQADSKRVTDSLRSTARSTGMVMVLTGSSRILGFLRQATVNAVFGATGIADVLNAVFNIPNNLRKLLAEGALSSAFLPILSQTSGQDENAGRELVRNLLTFQFLVLSPLLVLSVIFAPTITGFLLDFPSVQKQELAADLFRWFIHYSLLISFSAVLMGALNSRGRFAIPAATPPVFSLLVIAAVLLLHDRLGMYAMAVGVLVGGAAQILMQTPTFLRLGFDFRPSVRFRNPQFRSTMKRWLPVVAASSVFAINQQVAIYFASGLEDGASSALTNAIIFWQLPQGIFGVSIMTVLFPRMSREARMGNRENAGRTLTFGVEGTISLLVPSAVILALLGQPIISIAFQRGAFTLADTVRTAQVLWAYCVGMASVSVFSFLQRFFYANGDYRTPTYSSLVVVALSIGLSLWLKETALGTAGLALSNSIAFTVGTLILWSRRREFTGPDRGRPVVATTGKTLLASVPAAGFLLLVRQGGSQWWERGSSVPGLLLVSGIGLAAVGLVVAGYYLLRIEAPLMLLRRRGPGHGES